ncbi:protein kinase [Metapseudomonas lalkuanensis]|uniref:Protein kinase n=1 Tax=Metapseudomonas lalkuanensis TaxID=2604832 RepID=A0A5J6QHF9_9GAMM|nr:serine/threonine-protein kinase [Pseudomonas lalkuanensis]QEY61980.1 protein kinase [Pseudomonas lalkuanensis]UCO99761.1 protein kinase [Pseudomonas lalkuanensis]
MTDNLLDIPGYLVHGRLGKGGMAEVYLATQESLNRKVAVKVLDRLDDEAFIDRFFREARMLASLRHPSIVTIHDIDRLPDGRPYLAMEFLSGGDLGRYKGQVLEPLEALRIVRQIAGALAVVHDKGLVHRDIKPANILFRDDGTAVLTDFGIAKDLELDTELTQFNVAVGSPAYSSPEQAQCQPLDARSDIYSLGVILLELLTGENPYRGANYAETVLNHVQMDPPLLRRGLSDYQHVIDRMLAKDPDERFADCRVLLDSLTELSDLDLDFTRIAPVAQLDGARLKSKPTSAAPNRLRGLLWGLAGLMLLVVSTGGGYYVVLRMKIADLLELGEQRLVEGKLVEPAADNADFYFHEVLRLDNDNAQAGDGLQRVLAARVANILTLAEQRLAEDSLLQPDQDNAVFYFQQVLTLAPGNEQALAGLERVAQRFVEHSEAAYGRREFALALEYIDAGLQVAPTNPTLLELRAVHEQRVKKATRASTTRQARPQQQARQQEESNPIKKFWNRLFN